jgi:hypothetical protein
MIFGNIFGEKNWLQTFITLIPSRAESACFFTNLELRPVHGHVDAVGVGPQPQILLVVGVVDGVVELFVNLRQPETNF